MILYFYNMATYKEVTLDDFIQRYNNNEFRQDEFSIRNFLIFKDLETFKKYADKPSFYDLTFKDLNKNTPYKNKPFALTDKEIDLNGLDMDYIENDNL